MAKNLSRLEVEKALADAKRELEEDNLPNPWELERIAKEIASALLHQYSPRQQESWLKFPLMFVCIKGELAQYLLTKENQPTKIELVCLTEASYSEHYPLDATYIGDLIWAIQSQYPDYDIELTVATEGVENDFLFNEKYTYLWFDPEKGFFVPEGPGVVGPGPGWDQYEREYYEWVDAEYERWTKEEEREQINYRVMVECEHDYDDENL